MTDDDAKCQMRLSILKERVRSRRNSETDQQRQDRLAKVRERARSRRANETEVQRQNRLDENKERVRSIRMNETDEEHQMRINHQRIRSQANRINKRLDHETSDIIDIQTHDTNTNSNEIGNSFRHVDGSSNDFVHGERMTSVKQKQTSSAWPAPIPTALKETCLQQFLQRMSMSALAEVTCAICNIRTPEGQSKTIATSDIPHIHLLKVSDGLKDLVTNIRYSNVQNSNANIIESAKQNKIKYFCF